MSLLPEIVQYGPSARFECFTASKGSNNYFYLKAVNTLMRKGMGHSHTAVSTTKVSSVTL